jgi:hypothetical protein
MPKDKAVRLSDTYQYLQTNFGQIKRDRIKNAADKYNAAQVSDSIALGGVRGPEILQNAAETERRRALRALLLVNLAIGDADFAALPRIRATNNAKTEGQLKSEITYVLDYLSSNLVAHDVALAATNPPGSLIKWGRAGGANCMSWQVGQTEDSPLTCYSSVVYWAFQGGAISKRFLAQWEMVNGLPGSHAHNGMGSLLKVDEAIAPGGGVPEGCTVFFQTPINPLGHTVLSVGNGMVASCNGVTPPPKFVEETLQDGTIWNKMAKGLYHHVKITDLQEIYKPSEGYTYTALPKPFWEYYPISER